MRTSFRTTASLSALSTLLLLGLGPAVTATDLSIETWDSAPDIAPVELPPTEVVEDWSPAPEAVAPVEEWVPAAPAAPIVEDIAAPDPYIESVAPEPVAPQSPAIADSPAAPPISDAYIDTQDFSLGATEPYQPPETIVVNERGSGCEAVLSAHQNIASGLCAASSSPVYAQAAPPVTRSRDRWTEPSQPVANWTEPAATAQTIQQTLASANLADLPQIAAQTLKAIPPLKWKMPNGERLIFPLPLPFDITSAFGWRTHPITGGQRFHNGIDFGAPTGTPVLAAFSGRVNFADALGGYGLSVLLDHNEGQQQTRYAHLSDVLVQPGQWVQQGTVIGLVGSTGFSTGPHLHFETLQNTEAGLVAVDPAASLQVALVRLAQALQTARLKPQTNS